MIFGIFHERSLNVLCKFKVLKFLLLLLYYNGYWWCYCLCYCYCYCYGAVQMLYTVQLFGQFLGLVSNCVIGQYEPNNCLNTIQRVTSYWKMLFQISLKIPFLLDLNLLKISFPSKGTSLGKLCLKGILSFYDWIPPLATGISFLHRNLISWLNFTFVKCDLMKMIIMIRCLWLGICQIYWCWLWWWWWSQWWWSQW